PPPSWQPGVDVPPEGLVPKVRGRRWGLWILVGGIALLVLAVLIGLRVHNSRSAFPPRSQWIPVGQAANIGDGWRLKVLRVQPGAERKARAAEEAHPPRSGDRYFLINLAATYAGPGKGDPADLGGYGFEPTGADGAEYDDENG